MKVKPIIAAAVLTAGLSAAGATWLAGRYPQMSLADSSVYVLERIGTLTAEHLATGTPYDADDSLDRELENVRAIAMEIDSSITSLQSLDLAIALRNMVYQEVPLQPSPPSFDYANLDRSVFLMLAEEDVGGICGALTISYVTLLKAFGLEARYVGLFSAAKDAPDPVPSHATVDVLIDGRWIAMDPTFNFSIWHDGRRIGWAEARSLVMRGNIPTFATDGHALLPRRSVYEYANPPWETMQYMIFAPAPSAELQTLPQTWNGRINYANGRLFDSARSLTKSPIYVKLAR